MLSTRPLVRHQIVASRILSNFFFYLVCIRMQPAVGADVML